jgi:alpha-tubulin suppressor-like RCC1 family protein
VSVKLPSSVVPTQVCCGAAHSLVLTASGGVYGWGLNNVAQLGCGDRKRTHSVPCPTQHLGPDTSAPPIHPISAMIKKMLYSAGKRPAAHHDRDHPGQHYATFVCAGDRHSAVITDMGRVLTWGCGERGRLGVGPLPLRAVQDAPRLTPLTLYVTALAAGRSHMVAITDHYEVFAWGDNHSLQLGIGERDRRPVWSPVLVTSLIGAKITQVSCGAEHTCVITETGRMMAFGGGKFGRLGHANEKDVGLPRVVDEMLGMRCHKVIAGKDFTYAVCEEDVVAMGDDGEIGKQGTQLRAWAWGRGADGKLGSGAKFDLHAPTACDTPLEL